LSAKLRWFIVVAVVLAAACIRLGVWQLDRLQQRKARNAIAAAQMAEPPIDAAALPRDTAKARFRRVRVVGVPDYAHELIHTGLGRRGSPGVNLLTPVRIAGTDTAILINRGWVYSPDASKVDPTKWRDRDSLFVGYAIPFPDRTGAANATRPEVITRLSYDVVAKALPYPVFHSYVVVTESGDGDTTSAVDRIVRLPAPALDNGSHFSYAMQWFSFAAVALVGAVIVVRQSRGAASRRHEAASSGGVGESR
jgi:surfeit locus 1 family protein